VALASVLVLVGDSFGLRRMLVASLPVRRLMSSVTANALPQQAKALIGGLKQGLVDGRSR
jgi:hypothetical protein